jgi:antibiotic biosynthesis monooxygenase (ABM) superfamily enzyme
MDETIHVAVTRYVHKQHAAEFERRLAAFASLTMADPRSRGVHLLYPAAEAERAEYGILRSFASAADRDSFYASDLYKEWSKSIEPLIDGAPLYRELNGLEAWFREPHTKMPPRWKMAFLTWVAVWPVSMGVPALLAPLYPPGVPVWIRAGIGAAGIVLVLTWAAMPLLVKLFHGWIHGSSSAPATTKAL